MAKDITILILDDSSEDMELIQHHLISLPMKYSFITAHSQAAYESWLRKVHVDIILSDYQMPAYTGLDALVFAKENAPDSIFIFVTGTMEDEELAAETILQGAMGFVLKSNLGRLNHVILNAIKKRNDEKIKSRVSNYLQENSALDRIRQQVNNNKKIIERVKAYLSKDNYSEEELGIVMNDLDSLDDDLKDL